MITNIDYVPASAEQISEAIDWASDCAGMTGRMDAGRAMRYVERYYPGGWAAFVAECCAYAQH